MQYKLLQRNALRVFEKLWKKLEKRKLFKKIEDIMLKAHQKLCQFSLNKIFFKKQQVFLAMKRNLEFVKILNKISKNNFIT